MKNKKQEFLIDDIKLSNVIIARTENWKWKKLSLYFKIVKE